MKSQSDFRFLNWDVYKETKDFCRLIINLAKNLPKYIQYDLGSQLIRSSTSILFNIAEGSGKSSDIDFRRFLNIAIGSAYETLAHLDFLKDNGFLKLEEFEDLSQRLMSICRQLGGFKKKLSKNL